MGAMPRPQPSKLNLPEAVTLLTDHYACSQEHACDLLERAIHGRALRDVSIFHPDGAEVPTDVAAWRDIDWESGTVAIEISSSGSPPEHTPVVPLLSREEFVKNFEIDAEPGGATTRKRGGRPVRYDWDAFWIEVCRRIYEDGRPKTQSELVDEMLDWFMDRGEEDIDRSTIAKKITRLFGVLS